MIVFFVRHASAGTPHENQKLDEKRPLDKQGIQDCAYIGRVLASLDVRVDAVVSSPLKRALQTASLVGNEIGYDAKIVLTPALRPEANYAAFRQMLEEHRSADAIMVVGHEPNFSEFLGAIISDPETPASINLKKGAVARVDINNRRGDLRWLLTPKVVRSLFAATGHKVNLKDKK